MSRTLLRLSVAAVCVVCAAGCGVFGGGGSQSSSSGLGSFEPLVGVGAVIEATVVGFEGPRSVERADGSVRYPGRSENADEWTTPLGMPVITVDEVGVVATIGGTVRSSEAAERANALLAVDGPVDIFVPVGIYEQGRRYELWVSSWQDWGLMSYLSFNDQGTPIPALGLSDPERAFEVVVDFTGEPRIPALIALTHEMNQVRDNNAPQGPIMNHIFGTPETN